MQQINKVDCPNCGKEIELKPKADNPARLVAECNCGGAYPMRPVVEMDASAPEQAESSKIKKTNKE